MRLALCAIIAAALLALHPVVAEAQKCNTCGCRGGPGYRMPNGKCASWRELDRVCGIPATKNCTRETPPGVDFRPGAKPDRAAASDR